MATLSKVERPVPLLASEESNFRKAKSEAGLSWIGSITITERDGRPDQATYGRQERFPKSPAQVRLEKLVRACTQARQKASLFVSKLRDYNPSIY